MEIISDLALGHEPPIVFSVWRRRRRRVWQQSKCYTP